MTAVSWQSTAVVGVLTLVLGVIVTVHPSGSLNVVAVLIGVLMLLSGIFHLVRVFDADEPHRVWMGIAGLLFIGVGVVLVRHLNLTLAVIGLLLGLTWIVQGVVSLIAGISGGSREGRAWWIVFGLISVIAGIVVVSVPISSLTALAVLVGIWFIVMGLAEIWGAYTLRRAIRSGHALAA